MLSFIREQGAGEPSGGQTKGAGQHEGASAGDGGAQEYLTVAASSKNVRKSTILLVVLVAIGLVCLWFMIRESRPQAASAKQADEEQMQMEAAINRLTGVGSEMASKMDQIVTKFYEFSSVFQVEVDELSKDPFETKVVRENVQIAADDSTGDLEELRRLQRLAASLELLSVMQSDGEKSCCINDRILYPGDVIEGCTVTRIGADFVELTRQSESTPGTATSETKDRKIMLKLSQ